MAMIGQVVRPPVLTKKGSQHDPVVKDAMAAPGYQSRGPLRKLAAVGTLGLSELGIAAAQDVYDTAYGEPADKVKQGYQDAADKTRAHGRDIAGQYDARGQQAQGYYDPAQDVFNSWGQAYGYQPAPTNTRGGGPNGGPPGGGAVGGALGGLGGGGGNTSGMPSGYEPPRRAEGSMVPIPGGGATTPLQDYYGNFDQYQPTTHQDYLRERQTSGYGYNPLQSRYDERTSGGEPSYLEGELGRLSGFASEPTSAMQRAQVRTSAAGQPDNLDRRVDERRDFANQPTNTSSTLNYLSGLGPDRSDGFSNYLSGIDPGGQSGVMASGLQQYDPSQFSGQFANLVSGQGSQTGKMIADIQSGNTGTGRMAAGMQRGEGDTGRFLSGFDPNETAALGETYERLRDEGPTYEEDFYTSLLSGDNPAYNKLQEDAIKQAQRSAAARGGFISGNAMKYEDEVTSSLAAKEFANRGALAGQAGEARRAQLGQQLSGAEALDTNILGRNSLFADVAMNREGTLADLAGQGDEMRTRLSSDQDALLGDLYKHRDTQGTEKMGMLSDLAKHRDSLGMDKLDLMGETARFGDTETRLLGDLRLRGAGQQDDLLRDDQNAIDDIIGKQADRGLTRDRDIDSLYTSDDATRTTRMGDYASSLGIADVNRETRDANLDDLSGRYSDSIFDRGKAIDDLAGRAGDEAGSNADRRLDAADKASSEARDIYKTRFDQAMRMGDARSAIQTVYDMASLGAISATELSAIGNELAKAGVDAATIQAVIGDAISIIKEGGKAYVASTTGGKA